ncbi:MAG TPA: hypothetical protein ACFCUY_14185 [Xenococcaceae cyanobacterium]
MNIFTICPCCSSPMLHYLRNQREYWFCRSCWQEMPDFSVSKEADKYAENQIVNLSDNLVKRHKTVAV